MLIGETKEFFIRIDPQRIADMFNIFNTSGDGSMSLQEFSECYEKWICKIVKPRSTLITVRMSSLTSL